jgi:hypothetical protein
MKDHYRVIFHTGQFVPVECDGLLEDIDKLRQYRRNSYLPLGRRCSCRSLTSHNL